MQLNVGSELFMSLWDAITNYVPESKHQDLARELFVIFEDYGADPDELIEVCEDDPTLKEPLEAALGLEDDDELDEYED